MVANESISEERVTPFEKVGMSKLLANVSDVGTPKFDDALLKINEVGRGTGLRRYTTYSRVWEYPWVWFQLEPFRNQSLKVLDVGSELSPFPWFLASHGFDVVLSDVNADYWPVWRRVERELGLNVTKRSFDAQDINLRTGAVDIYLSVSVIEHVPNKEKVITEAARVLQPGGLLVMTFDICEPDMGMTFPDWNGRALTMTEFDDLFRDSAWFEPGISEIDWNISDIPDYLAWHRTTAPHHNYVTGAAVLRRNARQWKTSGMQEHSKALRGAGRTALSVARTYSQRGVRSARPKITGPIKSALRRTAEVRPQPLETLPNSPDLFRVYRDWAKHPELERKPGGWVYKKKFYPDYLTIGGASQAIFPKALRFCKGAGVDIGAGFWPLPGATSIDSARGPGLGTGISTFTKGSLDYIFSSHCLEHIPDWQQALDEWLEKLKIGGIVFLYLPHPECEIWHPGSPFVGNEHRWIPEPEVIKQALTERGCRIIKFDDGPDAMQSFFVCAEKRS